MADDRRRGGVSPPCVRSAFSRNEGGGRGNTGSLRVAGPTSVRSGGREARSAHLGSHGVGRLTLRPDVASWRTARRRFVDHEDPARGSDAWRASNS